VKTCFVSMPVGRKTAPETGVVVDFDRVYAELVVPAVSDAGLHLRSWRSSSTAASIQQQALAHIISSDVLLADVTMSNPNVMYELGVRHAANRGPTLLMRGNREPAPFYAGYLQAVIYDPELDLSQPESMRKRLAEALRSAGRRTEGSPVYEFFPTMRVELPIELHAEFSATSTYAESVKHTLVDSMSQPARQVDVRATEESLRSGGQASPENYLDLLRAYRNVGDWNGLIKACDSLPNSVASDPQTLQLLALALNRRSDTGDQDRAVDVMRKLVDETGGDADTFGILGRIYKDRWKKSRDREDLDGAIECYLRGFDLQPGDFYTGFNAVSLRFLRGDVLTDPELTSLLMQVKDLVHARIAQNEPDYWLLATAIELAVIERDWITARQSLARAMSLQPSTIMRNLSVESLERLRERHDGEDAAVVNELIARLQGGASGDDYA
jgi:MAP3K TRAFs-binding domain